MKNENLFALIEARLPRDLGGRFLETLDSLAYSWRDLLHATGRLAGWLASLQLPAEADGTPARVMVQVEKSPEALLLYLATLRAGLAYVPLNPAYQQGEVEHFLNDARPALFVCSPQRQAALEPVARAAGVAHVFTLGEGRNGSVLEAAAPFPDTYVTVRRRADDLAAILYTSGTTGRSKGAMLSHGNLSANALVLDEFWGFKEERDAGDQDVLLHALPLFHVHGLFVAAHAALLAGSRMLFMNRFDPPAVVRWLPKATVFMGVPTMYTRLLAEPGFDRHACRNMRLFISGSAPLLAETFEQFRGRTGRAIVDCRCRGSRCASSRKTAAPAAPAKSARCRCAGPACSRATGACRRRPPRTSPPTGSSALATWAILVAEAGRRVTSPWSGAPRTSSSPGDTTCIQRRSRATSTRCRGWPNQL